VDRQGPAEHDSDAAVDAELEFHFTEVVEGLIDRGWSEAAAWNEAQRRFGDRVRYRGELVRIDRRRRRWRTMHDVARLPEGLFKLDSWLRDLRYALRSLRRQPGFTTVAVLTLGAAIGLNTTLATMFTTMFWRPWTVANPHEVVQILRTGSRGPTYEFSYPRYRALADHAGLNFGDRHELWNQSSSGRLHGEVWRREADCAICQRQLLSYARDRHGARATLCR
jgi:hypothetical protein